MEENEAGEMVPKKKAQGPWRVVPTTTQAEESTPEQAEPAPQPVPPPQPPNTQSGSYVPPALRNQQKQQPLFSQSRLRKKVAPDVKSEELFPTLSAALTQEAPSSNPWNKRY